MKIEDLEKIDSKRMFRVYDQCYESSKLSYEQDYSIPDFKNIDHIVFAGMGGSGAIGDVFSSILSQNDIHTTIVKGYLLPKTVDKNTLVVTTSISGNTKETLSVLEDALKTDAKVLAFSSGGIMEEFVRGNTGVKYFRINQMHSPRASFFGFLYSALNILQDILPIKKTDISSSLDELKILQKEIGSTNLVGKNPAIDLARWIKNIPLIYYPSGLQSAAIRFKNSLQENSKMHVITEDVIEASHNGIVAWEEKRNVQPILLQGRDDYEKTRERWNIIKEFFKEKEIEYREVISNEGEILSKIVCLIYFLDYVSIYRSILSGIDPSPVIPIDFIKKKL